MGRYRYNLSALVLAALLCCASCGREGGTAVDRLSGTVTSPAETSAVISAPATETVTSAEAGEAPPDTPNYRAVPPEYLCGKGAPLLYDVSPLAEAYKTGDRSALTEIDCEVLDKASQILAEIVTEDMSDYDKELAVHDYIVEKVTYDSGALAIIKKPSEHSDEPYGALINGQAICKGYATTFRLFMEMLDIPCETAYYIKSADSQHAFNIVTIGGAKYYVDTTWDDPVPDRKGRLTYHTYFNMTRSEMAKDHLMAEDCPETPVLTDTFAAHNLSPEPQDSEELSALIRDAMDRNCCAVYFIPSQGGLWSSGMVTKDDKLYFTDKKLQDMVNDCCKAEGGFFVRPRLFSTPEGEAITLIFQISGRTI